MNLAGDAARDRAAERRRRYRGALLGVIVGDALGAPFEGHAGVVPVLSLARMEAGETPLRYTDDTAMTFALAESLLVCGRLDLDHLAASFAAAYHREPHRGYGAGAAQLLRWVAARRRVGGCRALPVRRAGVVRQRCRHAGRSHRALGTRLG